MFSTILLPPRAQLCIRYCSNKQQQFQKVPEEAEEEEEEVKELCTSQEVSPRRGRADRRGSTPPILCFDQLLVCVLVLRVRACVCVCVNACVCVCAGVNYMYVFGYV